MIMKENKSIYLKSYFHSHYNWLAAAVSVWDHADLSDQAELIQLVSLLISLLFQDWDIIQCILIVLARLYWTLIKMQWEGYDLARCDKVFQGLQKEERQNHHMKKSVMWTLTCSLSWLRKCLKAYKMSASNTSVWCFKASHVTP